MSFSKKGTIIKIVHKFLWEYLSSGWWLWDPKQKFESASPPTRGG
jgi:hypothetical protein